MGWPVSHGTSRVRVDQPDQAADVGADPEQRPGTVVAVQPGPGRDAVRTEVPTADLLVFHAQRTARRKSGALGGPLADIG